LTVTFPPTHEKGKVERPLVILMIELEAEDPEKHVILARIEPITDKQHWARRIRESGREEALLYVHGYNVTFNSAARQAAQIAYDLDFAGVPLLYSWPSQGTLAGYFTDERMVQTAEAPIDEFLRLLSVDAKITKLHVISHSMGNRLVAALLQKKFALGGAALIDQLILAAPDIDAGEFESKFARVLPKLAQRTTLYVSDKDVALAASAKVHGKPRAGDVAGGLLGLREMDTIDASNVETDFVAHSYYAEGKSVLADIFCVLAGTNPDLRAMLTKDEKSPRGPSWRVRRPDAGGALPGDAGKCAPPDTTPARTGVDSVHSGLWNWAGLLGAAVATILAALRGYRRVRRFRGAEVR
jgi:esterase/lipase superfamily enzyme